jgi:FtsP/CotA-like multicopper oxidase with cupredoxin domain
VDVDREQLPADGARRIDRRTLLRGGAALVTLGVAAPIVSAASATENATVARTAPKTLRAPYPDEQQVHLAATDGWVSMPASAPPITPFWPDPYAPGVTDPSGGFNTYAFGFRNVTGLTDTQVLGEKNHAQISAPILAFDEYVYDAATGQDNAVRVTLTNLGLAQRPDLVDGHTIHWHGFTNAIPLFDGVPELSISVPIGRSFTYYYRPHDPGTYMYHCHFEDVEHVQMGMTGVVFVRPKQNKGAPGLGIPAGKYAYNDGVPPTVATSTAYDREFAFMLTELWAESHYRDAHIQTTDWTDFKPTFWLMNGRAYPDTLKPNGDPMSSGADPLSASLKSLRYNPISSLVQANAGERVLLRIANLGYQQHAMTLDGIPFRVIAKDASRLVGSDGTDLSYLTNTVEVGPGESRDVILTAPSVSSAQVFRFYDRNYAYLSNGGGPGYGGQITEVRIHPAGTLPPQSTTNT